MMPVWNGELYLEYHRGTYTTQARNKRANRKSEFLLHDAEFIAAFASLHTDYQYPAAQLNEAWRTVCLNQFHDIIPGSSIGPVYEEVAAAICRADKECHATARRGARSACQKLDGDVLSSTRLSFAQPGLVFLPGDSSRRFTRDGKPVPVQPADGGLWVDAGEIPPYSVLLCKRPWTIDHRLLVHNRTCEQLTHSRKRLSPR